MRFNAANVPDSNTDRDDSPLPDGTYTVKVRKATEIDNKSGTGRYLELVLDVLGPTRAGATLWARYTTEHHTSEKAVTIGLGQLKDAARALGKPAFDHEVELVGCTGQCKVGRQRDNADRNEVKGWIVLETGEPKRLPPVEADFGDEVPF